VIGGCARPAGASLLAAIVTGTTSQIEASERGETMASLDQHAVDACAAITLHNAADVNAVFAGQGGFFHWYNATLKDTGAFEHRGKARETATIKSHFNSFWDQIPATFDRDQISMVEFCALMSVNIQETTGDLWAAPEGMNGPNRPHPGLAYAFDKIPGNKQSYNHSPNRTALSLFRDSIYLTAHRGRAGSQSVLNRAGGLDPAWGGDAWPSASYPSTAVDASRNGFVMQADFYKFRGRGVIQTTWRSDYKLLIKFILSPDAAGNQNLSALADKWRVAAGALAGDAQLEAIATISTNDDWDAAFSEPLILAKGVAIDSEAKGRYLQLAHDAATLQAGKTTSGSLLHMAAKINGGDYPATVAPMMATMMSAVAQIPRPMA
jgi:hypothetical protein